VTPILVALADGRLRHSDLGRIIAGREPENAHPDTLIIRAAHPLA
jgi:hypothetical protein